jgi:hypothetical protein
MVFVRDLRDEQGDVGQGVVRVSHRRSGGPARVLIEWEEEEREGVLTRELVET